MTVTTAQAQFLRFPLWPILWPPCYFSNLPNVSSSEALYKASYTRNTSSKTFHGLLPPSTEIFIQGPLPQKAYPCEHSSWVFTRLYTCTYTAA